MSGLLTPGAPGDHELSEAPVRRSSTATSEPQVGVAVLSRSGVSLILDPGYGTTPPRVLHWGAAVGPAGEDADHDLATILAPGARASAPPGAASPSLLPTEAEGWAGRPGIGGHRSGRWPHVRLELVRPTEIEDDPSGNARVQVESADAEAGLRVTTWLELDASGLISIRHRISNVGPDRWSLDTLRATLPVPSQAVEVVDWTGRWGMDRSVQRTEFSHGVRLRENRRGRTGHDATGLLVAGTRAFGFRSGQVWGVHLGWSGNHEHYAERLSEGWSVLGAGELLAPGEVVLEPGESYESPPAYFAYSAHGLDAMSESLHRWMRSRSPRTRSPRPLTLNTWEAVYFEQDPEALIELARRAASVGVERFVLDDGWFRGRRSDRAGLGDWQVDNDVWPTGLHPLVDGVRRSGMQFGLWVEPEMVNANSDLARAHPDWLLASPGRMPPEWRHQQVLDLARAEAYQHVLEALDSIVSEYAVDFLKWDHNRDLLEAIHEGRAGVRAQTLAAYRLMDELRARHPALEIESCASGGGRIDLGILQRVDRVWASDTNDPLDRQEVQRWSSVLVPPEMIGSHVGPALAHVTGRHSSLHLRCVTALFCHAGIEWDLTQCTTEELQQLAGWAAAYKRLRPLLHTGRVVRVDPVIEGLHVHGVASDDGGSAVFAYVVSSSAPVVVRPRLLLPGLREDRHYRVCPVPELEEEYPYQWRQPEWLRGRRPVTASGRLLAHVGLEAPILNPGQAVVIEIAAR